MGDRVKRGRRKDSSDMGDKSLMFRNLIRKAHTVVTPRKVHLLEQVRFLESYPRWTVRVKPPSSISRAVNVVNGLRNERL